MSPLDKIHNDWLPVKTLLYQEPLTTLNREILPNISYQPKTENIFKVFERPLSDIKVVILGQDPYPTPGDATGLAFSVSKDTRIPKSLRIIAEEISNSIEIETDSLVDKMKPLQFLSNIDLYPEWRTLEHWKDQGVFLLNTALTVETGKAGSHLKYWEEFTKRVITFISQKQPCIWIFWGAKAQKFSHYVHRPFRVDGYDKETIENLPINPDWNYMLTAPHPAAESYSGGNAGFYGCNHFYYVNSILKNKSLNEIKW